MRSNTLVGGAVVAGAALGLSACSGSDGPGIAANSADQATLSISLIDAPVDDVSEVNVEITALWIKSAGDGPPEELPLVDGPRTVNLLGLTEDNAALLVDDALIEAGSYEWLAMDVNATIDSVFDSYAVTETGEWRELFVPSSRIRLVSGFDVEANEAVQLIFDWDLRKGLVYPPGLGRAGEPAYLLKPAFRVIDVSAYGSLSGAILVDTVMQDENDCDADDPDLDVGNVVYVYEGHDVVPDDFDEELDVEPLVAVTAGISDDATRYEYRAMLPFGDYTVAFTCQAANDGAETNETGNADPASDTVAFFDPAANVTLSAVPGETTAVVDF